MTRDRPRFEFSSSSERTTKRVTWGAGISGHPMYQVVHKTVGDKCVPGHTQQFGRGGMLLL